MMAKTSFCEQPTDYVSKVLSERRKAKKPLMEKMRRARINESLNELKLLILEALNKDASRYSKMEKADVLEMTVHYLRELRRRRRKHRDASNPPKYRADFMHFTADISQKLTGTDSKDQLRANFLSQLASRCQGNSRSVSVGTTVAPTVSNESIKYISPIHPVMIHYPSPPPSPQRVSPACSIPTSPSWLTQAVLTSYDSKIEKPVSKATLWRPW